MGRLFKFVLYLISGIVAIFVIAAISFFLLFDPNDFRDNFAVQVKKATGRELTIDGDIEVSLFPWLAIDIGETHLGNAAGFGDDPFVSFKQARLSVRVLPMLLHREVTIGTAVLDGLSVNLEVARNGRSNWQDLIDGSEERIVDAGRRKHRHHQCLSHVYRRSGWRELPTYKPEPERRSSCGRRTVATVGRLRLRIAARQPLRWLRNAGSRISRPQ